jgi:putative transcriptional regulator
VDIRRNGMIRCKLSELLGRRRIHIRELAHNTGISYPTLWNLYHEKTTRIDFNTIDAICKALTLQVGELFEYVEIEQKKGKEAKPKKGGK